MSKEATPASNASPTVSVSEAFGLPSDWSFTKSLGMADATKGLTPETVPAVDHEEPAATPTEAPVDAPATEAPVTPAEQVDDDGKAAAKPVEPAKPADGTKPADPAKPAGGAKPATPAKPAKGKTKLAAPAKPADPAKPAKPADPAKPAEPAKPAVPAATVTPKFKVGDKEYTENELKAALAGKKPEAAQPLVPAKPEPTPAEKAAAEAEVKKKDVEYVNAVAGHFSNTAVDEDTLDAIMAGGAEGAKVLTQTLHKIGAEATLLARKSIYNEIMPIFERMKATVEPLAQQHVRAENERMEAQFKETYPDLADKMDTVMLITGVLAEQQADRVSKMSPDEFMATVAEETKTFISKFAPAAPGAASVPAAPAAATPAAPAAAAPVVPAVPAAAPAKPVAPTKPVVRPPGSNTPAAPGAVRGAGGKGSDADIIKTLW